MKKQKNKFLLVLCCICIATITIYACYKTIPLLASLKNKDNQEDFKNYIEGLGWKGWLTILGIQIMQIFVAFIPGEIVEVISGMLYGALGGLIICLIGILIGSLLIFSTIKFFASKNLNYYKEKLKTYNFLNNPKKIHIYLFILFLTPGIPKDIFIYLAPFLPIKLSSFIVISLIARIPSILSSTIIGTSLMNGNYLISVIIFIVFGTLGILGIIFNEKIINLFSKRNKKEIINHNIEN